MRVAAIWIITVSGLALMMPHRANAQDSAAGPDGSQPAAPATRVESAQPDGAANKPRGAGKEEILVVGTKIRGAQPTSPLTVITSADIEKGGYVSVEQLVRSVTQANGSSSSADAGTNFNTINSSKYGNGVRNDGLGAGINLRGLGEEATLILINGRRMATSAADSGSTTDISTIPISAIERVEIMPDGASAIYGSDAVGGVINFVLKKNYSGFDISLRRGFSNTRAHDFNVSGSFGRSWDSGHVLIAGSFMRDEPAASSKLGIVSTDQSAQGGRDYRFDACWGLSYPQPIVYASAGCYVMPANNNGRHLMCMAVTKCATGTPALC